MNNHEQTRPKSCLFGRAVWIYLVLAGAAATIVTCLLFDSVVMEWLVNHPCPWHKNAWVNGFRQLGKAGVPIWLLCLWSCLTDRWRPTFLTAVAFILVGAGVCPLKAIVRRCRPNMVVAASPESLPSVQNIPWQKKVSFPSGDTAVVFAAAATLSYSLSRLWMPPLFLAAGAIGVLRITALAHYPSDVLAGALLGVLCGMAALRGMACYPPLDRFRVKGQGRLIIALVLVGAVPPLSPYIGMKALPIFLRVYALPLIALVPLGLVAARLWLSKPSATRSNPVWEGVPTRSVTAGDPTSKPDSLKERTS